MKIYVASSWRNAHQPLVVESIAEWGFEVYDFRNPPHGKGGFAWSQIDPDWQRWTPSQWRDALDHELARDGYASDLGGMEWADACVLVLPSGRSSHLEAGWMAGRGKPVCVFAPEPVEPDLMVKLCDEVAVNYTELRDVLDLWRYAPPSREGPNSTPAGRCSSRVGRRIIWG